MMHSSAIRATTDVESRIIDTVKLHTSSLAAEVGKLTSRLNDLSLDHNKSATSEFSLVHHAQLVHLSEQLIQNLKQHRASDEASKSLEVSRRSVVAQDRLLQSLQYPQMQEIKEEISSAYENTYEWLFHDGSNGQRDCQNFVSWTRGIDKGPRIYWIHGKPGELQQSPSSQRSSNQIRFLIQHYRFRKVIAGSVHIREAGYSRSPAPVGRTQYFCQSGTLFLESGDNTTEVVDRHAALFCFSNCLIKSLDYVNHAFRRADGEQHCRPTLLSTNGPSQIYSKGSMSLFEHLMHEYFFWSTALMYVQCDVERLLATPAECLI